MCCFFTILVFLGPRAAALIWWLVDQPLWNRAFDTFLWPLLGFIFLPWVLLMYMVVGTDPSGVTGFDWVWLGLALLADIASYTGGAWGNRNSIPGYPTSSQ
jgi:hypothetical protein